MNTKTIQNSSLSLLKNERDRAYSRAEESLREQERLRSEVSSLRSQIEDISYSLDNGIRCSHHRIRKNVVFFLFRSRSSSFVLFFFLYRIFYCLLACLLAWPITERVKNAEDIERTRVQLEEDFEAVIHTLQTDKQRLLVDVKVCEMKTSDSACE